ncbi:MAG: septal ring lytic transglycosylase RlpA family protein [Spirochaetaceae bacterium]|nr:septal ring lytic transglycosylase RlpA family protein [Spirochaetaceae bacterium]
MKKISAVFVFSLAMGVFLWAQSEEPIAVETEASSVLSADMTPITGNFRQEGVASWYGAEFAGRATASGEIFDPTQFTAAHADLPFGTYLIVTNTENGKKIAVRVNDRGPFVRSRILDVSRAAAERLDMLAAGTAKVVIESTTRESAQSLMRELGVSATLAGTTPAASRTSAPASSGSTATATATSSSPQTPASSGTAAAPSSPQTPASSGTAAASSSPQTPASSGTVAANAAPSSPQTPASQTNTTGTPVMAPAAPRVPSAPVPVPGSSVSRVTGQVENIPEIRRPSDPGYIVVDEQVPPTATPRATTSVITPVSPAASVSATSRIPSTPTAAQTPASAASPPEANPAASVPVTGPRPGAEKIEFTGSPIVQGKKYRVQVGSFTDMKNASGVFLKLSDAGLSPSYEPYEDKGDKYYRVVITNVKAENADNLSRKLAEIGITEALAREDAN